MEMDGWMMDTSPWMEVDTWNGYGVTHDAYDTHDAVHGVTEYA